MKIVNGRLPKLIDLGTAYLLGAVFYTQFFLSRPIGLGPAGPKVSHESMIRRTVLVMRQLFICLLGRMGLLSTPGTTKPLPNAPGRVQMFTSCPCTRPLWGMVPIADSSGDQRMFAMILITGFMTILKTQMIAATTRFDVYF